MKVIIAGSRTFYNYELLKSECDRILKGLSDIEIVSGTAKGADSLGERYALERGYKLTKSPADWKTYGNMAGIIRNAVYHLQRNYKGSTNIQMLELPSFLK